MTTASDDLVTVPLSEIQRLRDALARLRDYAPMVKVLFNQVAGLHERLAKQIKQETTR